MHVLVIGGNGFIGSHLVDHLLEKGHHVRVFDTVGERFRKPLKGVDYRISSLENMPDLYEALLGIEVIFHLASASVPSTSNIDTVSDIQKNLIPTLNILNLAVKLGIQRIIYFSSGGTVYGNPSTNKVNEEHPLNPISSYGIVKATNEMYLSLFQRIYNIKPLILRPSNPFGPRQGHYMAHGVISTFLRKVMKNEELVVLGDGSAKKDYIYIDDLIDLCYQLSFSDEEGVFNIGTGVGTNINDIIQKIKTITNSGVKITNLEKPIYDVDHFELDISKMKQVCGDFNFTPLEVGIAKTWTWLQTTEKSL
ncbi:MAG: NAD-dependent epimerase/dehydratase family protein [Paludibacter sp.]|nr:NAD-dependent epimerase/dehydratase family protein [Paludibacter sp.]